MNLNYWNPQALPAWSLVHLPLPCPSGRLWMMETWKYYLDPVINRLPRGTLHCTAPHHTTIQCNALHYNTPHHNTIQCNALHYNTLQCTVDHWCWSKGPREFPSCGLLAVILPITGVTRDLFPFRFSRILMGFFLCICLTLAKFCVLLSALVERWITS